MKFKQFTLDPFQEAAVESIDNQNSVVVSAATGTGKTLIADYAIDKLLKKGRKVFNKSFLKYRFGKTKGYLIYIIARDNDRFTKLRGIAMGNKIGKQIYNKLKKNYSIHNKLNTIILPILYQFLLCQCLLNIFILYF